PATSAPRRKRRADISRVTDLAKAPVQRNEPGKSLLDRFQALLGANTRFFDCLVGYFMISGFHKLYPALEQTEKVRILIGLKTDQKTFELLQQAQEQRDSNTASPPIALTL